MKNILTEKELNEVTGGIDVYYGPRRGYAPLLPVIPADNSAADENRSASHPLVYGRGKC